MLSKKTKVKMRSFHRWLGVVVGVQMLLWIVSGIYFAWVSIGVIRGDNNKAELSQSAMSLTDIFNPAQLKVPPSFRLKTLKLEYTPRGPIVRLESENEEIKAFGALSGEALDVLSGDEVIKLGMSQVKSHSKVVGTVLLNERGGEYKGPVPVYRMQLDDFLRTRLYIDPWSGKLIVQRNALWRIYDFLWMLHIMDYESREDFNNPWLRIATLAALGLLASGYILFMFGKMTKRKSN